MKYFKFIILYIILFIVSSQADAQQHNNIPFFLHTVEKGQNLTSIATMYGVTTYEIIALNPDAEKVIKIGEKIKIPQKKLGKNDILYHTIQQGETLYKVMNFYKVSAKAICEANPGLSADNFQAGKVIVIPTDSVKIQKETVLPTSQTGEYQKTENTENKQIIKSKCRDMHQVKRKETLFSISKLYGLSEKELLNANPDIAARNGKIKKGEYICIPYQNKLQNKIPSEKTPDNKELFTEIESRVTKYGTVKIAVLLPFMLDDPSTTETKKMLDYYEGFLMAVDSLKHQGYSYQIYTYDCGSNNSDIETILLKPEMKSMHIILGPTSNNQIKLVSDFAKQNRIRMIIPFTSKDTEVFNNPYIYQVNTPQSYLYSEVFDCFVKKFSGSNVIFIDVNNNAEKADFIKSMKEALSKAKIRFKTISINTPKEMITESLKLSGNNIFIPTSGEYADTNKIVKMLEMIVDENASYNILLFGYPEYQAQSRLYPSFYKLNTYIYTSFFANNNNYKTIQFNQKMKKWFNREQTRSIPRFGMLGFDTGYFFLRGLSIYGNQCEKNINKMNITPYQSFFRFERVNNWGGFINKKVVFINFKHNKNIQINEF